MLERPYANTAVDGPLRDRLGRGLIAAMLLALSACVSEADPREGSHDPLPDVRAEADVREGGAGDAARADTQDTSVPDADDGGSGDDAGSDIAIDAGSDVIAGDVGDVGDVGDAGVAGDAADAGVAGDTGDAGGSETTDVATDPVVADTVPDSGSSDAGAPADTTDAGTAVDVTDAGSPIDVNDAGAPGDVSDAANDGDANAADALADGADARDGAGDGGVFVFYQENFDTGLGTFSSPVVVCGAQPPQWSNVMGYAHASDPATTGVSRISSPAVVVPANTSNVRLRMSHRFNTDQGYDAAQLLISVNGGTATQVTTFVTGGYINGGQTNPTNCSPTIPGFYPGWSGTRAESVSEVNLSAAPFNVVAGNTVTITFRMTSDNVIGDVGWDINWVTLSANSP